MRIRRTYREILNSRNVVFRIDNDAWDKSGEVLKPYELSRQDYLRLILKILVEKGETNPDTINMVNKFISDKWTTAAHAM